MRSILLVVALGYALQVIATPHVFERTTSRYQSPNQVQQQLGPQLSRKASIYFPGNSNYTEATSRWSPYKQPNISVVVEVGNAADVVKTIQYANSKGLPFLAVNRGHGSPITLEKVHHGIEIWLSQLDQIDVAKDGKTAVLGGGVYIKQIIDALAQKKKVAASGACGCVGLMGAGLGGGHGRLQGFHGLVSDNFVSLNVVLWNGTQVTASSTSHPDLFWGLQGAGHNFGIVTSLTYKIYDEPSPTWFYANYFFTQDKIEAMFEELNRQADATLPPEMGYVYINYLWLPEVSTTEPVALVNFNYAGSRDGASPFITPFLNLGPVLTQEGNVPYSQIANVSQTDINSAVCARGYDRLLYAVDLVRYNVSTNRAIYDLFKNVSAAEPKYQGSVVIFESYSEQGVKAVPSDSTAYPHRANNIVFLLAITYTPDPSLDDKANTWGEQTRALAHAGQPANETLDVYVNYANGRESLEALYGYEPWRLAKLRGLKAKYDPHNKFGYYLGIS